MANQKHSKQPRPDPTQRYSHVRNERGYIVRVGGRVLGYAPVYDSEVIAHLIGSLSQLRMVLNFTDDDAEILDFPMVVDLLPTSARIFE